MNPRLRLIGAAGLCVGVVVLAVLRPVGPSYPTDDAGWNGRWREAAVEIGVIPGDGWDRWTDAAAGVVELLESGPTPEQLRTRLAAMDWPERVTPPDLDAVAPQPDWGPVFDALAQGVERAAGAGDADNAVGWARLAYRIEQGVGAAAGYAGVVERCRVGAVTDRAVRAAAAGALFSPVLPATDADENRLGDLIGLCIEGGGFGVERATALERERVLRAARRAGLSGADNRRIERLFADLADAHRGRQPAADRALAFLDAVRDGRHPAISGLLPDIAGATDARRAARAERVGLQVMLSLERHRVRRGAYPGTLDQLAPDGFVHVPVDPFGFGGGFGYRVLDPASPTPAGGYLLYSRGPDRDDDGGEPLHPDGGGDLVLNPVPPAEPLP